MTQRTITVTRIFNTPRELVWKAWTTAEHLAQWWGPNGWTLSVNEMDFRPGGTWQYCMQGPDGEQSCGKAVYHEIVEPERIVYTDYFLDADGKVLEGMPEGRVTVEFIPHEGKTRLINTVLYPTQEDLDRILEMGMEAGMGESLDRLAAHLTTI